MLLFSKIPYNPLEEDGFRATLIASLGLVQFALTASESDRHFLNIKIFTELRFNQTLTEAFNHKRGLHHLKEDHKIRSIRFVVSTNELLSLGGNYVVLGTAPVFPAMAGEQVKRIIIKNSGRVVWGRHDTEHVTLQCLTELDNFGCVWCMWFLGCCIAPCAFRGGVS